jgi:chromosome segregation ATPase
MNDLTIKNRVNDITTQVDMLFDRSDKFNQITTRAVDPDNKALAQFHIFDEDKLAKVAENMPEINRATRSLGRKNTQTTNRLMTLTMLSDVSPFRVLRQCLSQIENKRSALKENRFKILKDRNRLEKLQTTHEIMIKDLEALENSMATLEEPDQIRKCELEYADLRYKLQDTQIKIEEIASRISDSMLYIEGCLKEIASFQSSYEQIRKNNNIPEDWDEEDMEQAEVRSHVRTAFLHAYRDVSAHGRLGMGTLEYLQQFGIHPHTAQEIVSKYIKETNAMVSGGEEATYRDLENFLDIVQEKFKDNYKAVLAKLGIDQLYDKWYMYKE